MVESHLAAFTDIKSVTHENRVVFLFCLKFRIPPWYYMYSFYVGVIAQWARWAASSRSTLVQGVRRWASSYTNFSTRSASGMSTVAQTETTTSIYTTATFCSVRKFAIYITPALFYNNEDVFGYLELLSQSTQSHKNFHAEFYSDSLPYYKLNIIATYIIWYRCSYY